MSRKKKNLISIFVFILSLHFLTSFVFAEEKSSPKIGKVTTSVLNLRTGPSLNYKVFAQLRKSKQLTILSSSKNWYKVETSTGKIGWVIKDYVSTTSSGASTKASSKVSSSKTVTKASAKVPAKTSTKVSTKTPTKVSSEISRGSETDRDLAADQDISTNIISYSKNYLGVSYVWGGTSPKGFDCSGFVQYVYKHFGIKINRVACDQATDGTFVAKDDLIPGDLVFFDTNGGHSFINHVGMYIGGGRFIQASSGHGEVMLTDITKGFYANTYITARRILK